MTDPIPQRSWPRRLAIGAGVAVLTLLCVELGLRTAGFGPAPDRFRWLAHPLLQAVPAPSQDTWFCKDDPSTGERRLPLHTNAFSQRGPDFPLEKPAGEQRVLVVGDSLTFGQGVLDEQAWPAQLGALLRAAPQAGERWRAINASANGWSPWHYQRYVETQALRFSPDVVVVGLYFGNDMLPPPELGGTPPWLENALRRSALYDWTAHLYRDRLSARARAARDPKHADEAQAEIERYIGVRESALTPREQRKLWALVALPALERMRDLCRERGVAFLCVLIPTPLLANGQASREAYDLLKAGIERSGITVIDPLAELGALRETAWLPWDPGHLSVAGNACLAGVVVPAVRNAFSGR